MAIKRLLEKSYFNDENFLSTAVGTKLNLAMVGFISQTSWNKSVSAQQLSKNCVKVVKLIGIFKPSLGIISVLAPSTLLMKALIVSLTKKQQKKNKPSSFVFLPYRAYSSDEIFAVLD